MSTASIRLATFADLDATVDVERAADALLVSRFGALDWPPPASAAERSASPGFVLVAEDAGEVVGFAQVLEVEGDAHLEQVSVLPEHGSRGHRRRLVEEAVAEARRRGHERVTLRTYSDVPWNAPFYASCGFRSSLPDSEFHRSLVEIEERLGLTGYGRREQMTAVLRT